MKSFFIITGLFFLFDLSAGETCLAETQKVFIGPRQSRGLLNIVQSPAGSAKAPIVILVPGSGAMGPEAMFPGKIPMGEKDRWMTTDGRDHSIFAGFTAPLNAVGVSTLAIGKPGVDFFHGWGANFDSSYYDKDLFDNLQWADLVENVRQAVLYVRSLPSVDPNQVFVLGHSESTQVVADYAMTDSKLAGLILFGVVNSNFATSDSYQVFDDYVENFAARSVDANHDGFVDLSEAQNWSEDFQWSWKPGQDRVSLAEISSARHADSKLQAAYLRRGQYTLRQPVYNRSQTLAEMLSDLSIPLYVYTGEMDVMTVPSEAWSFGKTCQTMKKTNCFVTIVPGLGHGFSAPIAPRAQPYLDYSFGPVASEFQDILRQLGSSFLTSKNETQNKRSFFKRKKSIRYEI